MSTEAQTIDRAALLERFRVVRQASVVMCRPLADEDYRIQPRAEVSPPWWNLGHTSWFFARNVLCRFSSDYSNEDRRLDFLLNSYYVSLGPRVQRADRGRMARPTNDEIHDYRASVDQRIERLVETVDDGQLPQVAELITVGVHHEQQHQELFYTEIKAIYHELPTELRPSYLPADHSTAGLVPRFSEAHGTGETPVARNDITGETPVARNDITGETPVARNDDTGVTPVAPLDTTGQTGTGTPQFTTFPGGLYEFGHREGGWCWDNELPVHRAYVDDFALADRPVTCAEFLEFVEDGGYRDPLLWLDNAWVIVESEGWRAPLYWEQRDGRWWLFTLSGTRRLDPSEPVCHVSFYEADAFTRWRRANLAVQRDVRLPTEYEWEHAARESGASPEGANLLEAGRLHPAPIDTPKAASATPSTDAPTRPTRMLGDVWEWTSSYYQPYPGYRPFAGSLAEYNDKFMDNQRVMRGGSCVTPPGHVRISYRNFWSPATRFQMTGFRLVKGYSL